MRLLKKYHHAKDDLDNFTADFTKNHQSAKTIKANICKVRIKNSDKAKGKSVGYRIYYYVVENESVYFLTIYDKSDNESIDESVLDEIIGGGVIKTCDGGLDFLNVKNDTLLESIRGRKHEQTDLAVMMIFIRLQKRILVGISLQRRREERR